MMNVAANQHYLPRVKQKRGKPERPAWLLRLKKQPAHWSGPAMRHQESLIRVNEDLCKAINQFPPQLAVVLHAMEAKNLQLQHMVSKGVIHGMVRDEFWNECYTQVQIQVNEFAKIMVALKATAKVNHRILSEICKEKGLPPPLSLDHQLEAAFEQARIELSQKVA
jgi:hypothetical protein